MTEIEETNTTVQPDTAENKTITAEEIINLLETLNLEPSDHELGALLEDAKNGESIDREQLMFIITKILEDDQHLEELHDCIDSVEFDFRG